MLYLINQNLPYKDMEFIDEIDAKDAIALAVDTDCISSALDDETIELFSNEFDVVIPEFDDDTFYYCHSPDDVVLTLEDNLELGDVVIALNSKTKINYIYEELG